MHKDNHDEMYASGHHADPGQGPPVANAVSETENDEHANADEQRLEDGETSARASMNSFGDVDTLKE